MTGRGASDGAPGVPSDASLIERAQADPDSPQARRAAGDLLLRHQDRLYAWCWRFVRDHERALDLTQEVMMLAYRALPSFEQRSRFSSWLYMIARRRCLREVRRPGLLTDTEADPDQMPGVEADPAAALEELESEEETLELLRRHLDPLEQKAIWLRCFEGASVETVTELLGIEERSGARGVLQSARRKLRAALDRRRRMEEMQ